MTTPSPQARQAARVARDVLAVKLAGGPLPGPLTDEVAAADPDLLFMELAVVAAYFAHHLAREGGLDLDAEWAGWTALANLALGER